MLPRKARLDSCNNCGTKGGKKKKKDHNLVFCSETKVHLGDKNYANIMHYWKTATFFAVPAPAGRWAGLGGVATPRERLCPSSPGPRAPTAACLHGLETLLGKRWRITLFRVTIRWRTCFPCPWASHACHGRHPRTRRKRWDGHCDACGRP